MTRRESREKAVCYLYEYEVQRDKKPSQIIDDAVDEREESTNRFAKELFRSAVAHLDEIDERISQASANWRIGRIGKVSLAILRIAVCELCFLEEPTPKEIAVNEALELARLLDTDKSVSFINGVLANIVNP